MGFNSVGLDRFMENAAKIRPEIIRGINIGKNAATPLNNATKDYVRGLRGSFDLANYVAINISSPNTRDLRQLQQHDALNNLLSTLNQTRRELVDQKGKPMPLVVKIGPDIGKTEIDAICSALRRHQIDGVAATNTTVSRESVEDNPLSSQTGGMSGPPVRDLSTGVVAALHHNLQGEIPIIGIGGIDSADAALEKFQAGASLVQLYTGFIYNGPVLIRNIVAAFKRQGNCG
jgi:dihydroorotate dehydrogenase